MEPVRSTGAGVIVRSLSAWDGPSPSVIFGRLDGPATPTTPTTGTLKAQGPEGPGPSPSEAADVLVAQAFYASGTTSALIRHSCEEVVFVLQGEGAVLSDRDEKQPLRTGDLALIRAGAWHAMVAGKGGLGVVFWFPMGMYPPTERLS